MMTKLDLGIKFLDLIGKFLIGFVIVWTFTLIYKQREFPESMIKHQSDLISLSHTNQEEMINNQHITHSNLWIILFNQQAILKQLDALKSTNTIVITNK